MKDLISKIRNTSPYENLSEILGKDLGKLLYELVDEAEKADKQLDVMFKLADNIQNTEVGIHNDPLDKMVDKAIKECHAITSK